MTWHERIDSTVAAYTSWGYVPKDLGLSERLRTALKSVEDPSTANPRTLRAAQAIAECAVHPMVTELVDVIDGPSARLRRMNEWWPTRTARDTTYIHDSLRRVSRYYSPQAGGRGWYDLGSALHATGYLVECAYPVDHARPDNPDAQPKLGDMAHVAGLFAVVSRLHLDVCDPERNHTAIEDLARTIESA